MAFESIEASFIGDQLKANVGRMTTNMRDNATGYKSAIALGRDAASIGVIMKADANLFLARMQTVVDLATRNNTKYQAALTSNGWPAAEVNSLRTTLGAVCDHVIAATLTTGAQVNTEADLILANVPVFERIF